MKRLSFTDLFLIPHRSQSRRFHPISSSKWTVVIWKSVLQVRPGVVNMKINLNRRWSKSLIPWRWCVVTHREALIQTWPDHRGEALEAVRPLLETTLQIIPLPIQNIYVQFAKIKLRESIMVFTLVRDVKVSSKEPSGKNCLMHAEKIEIAP